MKFSAQEEYGLRCLLHLGRLDDGTSRTIPQISQAEGLSSHNVAKLMRILRRAGVVKSVRGQAGGYTLSRPADQLLTSEILAVLGGRLFDPEFCEQHAGIESLCTHSVDCSIRSLWRTIQLAVDQVLARTTLEDLLCAEGEVDGKFDHLIDDASPRLRVL